MAKEIYRLGHRFGAWTLLAKLPVNGTNRRWRCRCDCGTVKDVIASNVTRGISKGCGSCGARRREREKPGVTAIKPLRVAVGDVYHDWTVLEILAVVRRNRLVRCRCACGTVDTVFAASLRSGRSRGCRACVASRRRKMTGSDSRENGDETMASGRLDDLTGRTFNRWTVIERLPSRDRNTLWKCRCECGNEGAVQGPNLKSGASKGCRSCGGNAKKRK